MGNAIKLFSGLVLILHAFIYSGSAVTNGVPAGRAGDYLLWFIKAKYVSYKYDIPLLIPKSFEHLEYLKELRFYRTADFVPDVWVGPVKEIILDQEVDISIDNCLYRVNYFFQSTQWTDFLDVNTWSDVLQDQQFLVILRDALSLERQEEYLLPKDRISIAVHVRTGGGYDTAEDLKRWPFKFPYLNYYAQQLNKIGRIFNGKPLFAHIFTDDKNPEIIAEFLKVETEGLNIIFSYRKDNSHDKNVVQDLIHMTKFDCLIRSMSNFAQVAQLLGNYKVVIYPKQWLGQFVISAGVLYNTSRRLSTL